MAHENLSDILRARCSPELATLVRKEAIRQGCSESEIVRKAIGTGFQGAFQAARSNVVRASSGGKR